MRSGAALLALWVMVILSGPGPIGACAMHDHLPMRMHEAVGHRGEMPAQAPARHGPSPTQCTCIGACCVNAAPAAPSAPVLDVPVVSALATTSPRPAFAALPGVAAPDVVLPPAVGPPAARG